MARDQMAGSAHGRFRYGAWQGGPDPLAPPYDVRAALDELGAQVLEGNTLRESLRGLLRRGMDGRPGLDELAERGRRMRNRLRRRGDLAGTLDHVREALDHALDAEREVLAGERDQAARLAELELETIPDDVAGAVQALSDYGWHSPEAAAAYQSILEMLRKEVLGAQFAGMKQALTADPAAMEAVRDMLADLNALLAAHARGQDTTDLFADFMDRHGELFPEQPRSVDELVDALARRRAAAERLLVSLRPEQRDQLAQLLSTALRDPDLAFEMAQLADNLHSLRPGLGSQRPVDLRPGGQPLGYSDAVGAVAELADLESLERQLSEAQQGGTLDDVDVDLLERQLGSAAVRDLGALRELERELERQGYVSRGDDGLRLTPRAVRRLGESALKRVFQQVSASTRGDHDDRHTGSADERTGLTRPWVFGDELPLDAARTVGNAVLRGGVPTGAGGLARGPRGTRDTAGATGPAGSVQLAVEDFEVAETERRASAAVALCVDLSFSMVQEGRWGAMKQTALALSHLVATRYRQDALQIIGFNLAARRLTPVQLADAEPDQVQGTNLQHALMLAGRHVRRHPDTEPVVLVVTDGEPTARLGNDCAPQFMWPPTEDTIRATVAQVDELARYGATLNFFLLGDDPRLARFVDAVGRRAAGRVFTPDVSRLGEYVVADYLRARRGRR